MINVRASISGMRIRSRKWEDSEKIMGIHEGRLIGNTEMMEQV
jgi:hypothetical protein